KTCERAFVAGAKVPPFFTRANFYGKFFRFFFEHPPNTLESHGLRDELFFAGAREGLEQGAAHRGKPDGDQILEPCRGPIAGTPK
ncbi:hypothetical protein, partial [Flavobacterium caeni]|uniref:hypothetical protein n=1 Tax=Flavobacterium caeni TaxID=490189 RepID=UPI001B8B1C53